LRQQWSAEECDSQASK